MIWQISLYLNKQITWLSFGFEVLNIARFFLIDSWLAFVWWYISIMLSMSVSAESAVWYQEEIFQVWTLKTWHGVQSAIESRCVGAHRVVSVVETSSNRAEVQNNTPSVSKSSMFLTLDRRHRIQNKLAYVKTWWIRSRFCFYLAPVQEHLELTSDLKEIWWRFQAIYHFWPF